MERRTFITSVMGGALSAAVGASTGGGQQSAPAPEFYVWRQYLIRNGTQPRRVSEYLQQAAVPALNRLGHSPIGVFDVFAGVPAPSVFVLIPCASLDSVGTLDLALQRDEVYVKAAAPYFDVTATDPVYVRQEVSILAAFPKLPRVEVPAATAARGPRLFELRIYENPSEKAHRMKVRMFDEMGEIEIFRKVGLTPVFFARTLAGTRMPNLTYMLVHDNMAAREKSWDAFRNAPEWKALIATPGYSDAELVTNIETIFLRPAAASQI